MKIGTSRGIRARRNNSNIESVKYALPNALKYINFFWFSYQMQIYLQKGIYATQDCLTR